ncbi:hypothetical protein NDU88_004552 [Pleurodeles waltl]|uniref:Uncharacterized protein n=1 Tax=Pleurodeles waltl TaxID=8319 RepID=A0AAV7MVH1_PLEWA|nr:hypothetical protein NDU88_004552 [Pleurodeles waltl]
MQRRFWCHGVGRVRHRTEASGPRYKVAEVSGVGCKVGPLIPADASPVELRCFGTTSRGCDDVTRPQALRWRPIITDVGLTTLRCQRSRVGSAVAAT